ncbi:DUF4429 domain-containing protein [Streptomyces sp. AV19]|uniref:DUF4429 domain-containing protein n=1 Tax=Streptomyces sp. AV19 TaxID=2793068 RepID=UPI0018FE0932|nr:DUF4429 domain-containing protein [Streptomyces sp. AV19]MBH1939019.1 DUF4429 domain-containing protein [Streptomyces sp. AV19]MDG4532460.1 DUF4429 domain-containing protein [Streptomyces sp. AV19]
MWVEGRSGLIGFDGFFITVVHHGLLHRATCGRGEKRIPVHQLGSVRWKPAGRFALGFIQFSLAGGNEKRSLFGRQSLDAAGDENALLFTYRQQSGFEKLKKSVEETLAIRWPNIPPGSHPSGPLAVIGGLQSLERLLENGTLTHEEFAVLKPRLLGLLPAGTPDPTH